MMEDLKVALGTRVQVELLTEEGEAEALDVDIVPDESADYQQGFLGQGTPLALALIGQSAGDTIPYPLGDIVKARVLSVIPSTRKPPKGLQERRAETTRKAVEESDRTNAILFASSFSGKWGDYDPAGLEHWEQKDSEEEKKNK